MAAPTTTITATIARVNERGVQIQERAGEWLNISKYADPMPVMPMVGTVCRITLDAAGTYSRQLPWPAFYPPGTSLFAQFVVSEPPGYVMSHAVLGVSP